MKFTNWRETLESIIKGADPSPEEHYWLVRKAFEWPECACGELCKALPKGERGEPADMKLVKMGANFYACIRNKIWAEALWHYNAIEARTALLLEPILAKELQEVFDLDPTILQPEQNFIVEEHNQIQ